MKKIIAVLTLFLALTICGCTPSVKSEEALKSDLIASDLYKELYNDNYYSITDFTITERRTDSKAGTDYIEVDTKIEDSEQTHYFSHQIAMNYKLYDDGWKPENIVTIERKATPISGPDYNYSEETIKNMIASAADGTPENIEIGEVMGSIEERHFSCAVTFVVQHKYVDDYCDFVISWFFNEDSASWEQYTEISTYYSDWSKLYGLYYNEIEEGGKNTKYKEQKGILSVQFKDGKGYLKHAYYRGSHYTVFYNQPEKEINKINTYEMFPITECTNTKFLEENGLLVYESLSDINAGYRLVITNYSECEKYQYIVPAINLFIGKDEIATFYDIGGSISRSTHEIEAEYVMHQRTLDSSYDLNNLG